MTPGALSPPDLTGFFIHLGPAGLIPDEAANIKAAGTHVPGATISVPPQITAGIEIGAFVSPNIAVAVTVGVPPTATFDGAGTIAALGKLGSALYGPVAITGQYHFTKLGPIQPYVGVGPTCAITFSDTDAALSRFRLDSACGAVGQVGADVMITDRWGVFLDVKKAYLRTDARGRLGFIPVTAAVRLDPLVLSGGLTYRF